MNLQTVFSPLKWVGEELVANGQPIYFDVGKALLNLSSHHLQIVLNAGEGYKTLLAGAAGLLDGHFGPFSIELSMNDVHAFIASMGLSDASSDIAIYAARTAYIALNGRFVVTDDTRNHWAYAFPSRRREEITRFVYDRSSSRLLDAGIRLGASGRNSWWIEANRIELGELEDCLVETFPDALKNPFGWRLAVADKLPNWVGRERRAAL